MWTKRRRMELLRTTNEVARLARLAPRTVTKVEAGEPVRELNLYKLDAGLDWQRGSAVRILQGGEPAELGEQDQGEDVDELSPYDTDGRIARLEQRVAELEEALREARQDDEPDENTPKPRHTESRKSLRERRAN